MMRARAPPVSIPAASLQLGVSVREWASTDTGVTVVGVVAGISIGEWLGTMISGYFNMEAGWADIAGKAVGKGILSFVLFVIGRRTGGLTRVFMNGAAIGSLASILGDIISQITVPGFLGLGESTTSVKGITMKVNNPSAPAIGATNKVLTTI